MKNRFYFILTIIISVVFLLHFSAWAVPKVINYQGKLTDSNGDPLEGNYTMKFSLYPQETGGVKVWFETQIVSVNNGVFSVQLGAQADYPLETSYFDNDELYLEITIYNTITAQEETLSPRIRLLSTAFSIKSENSDTLDGKDSLAFANATHTHTFTQITGTATDAQIPNTITINYAANAGNADMLDGLDSSSFTKPSTDYGRYNVAANLYEGTSTLTSRYVNEGQTNSITSNMIQTGAVLSSDILNGSITKSDLNNNAKCSLDASDGSPTNSVYVNSTGNVGIGNTNPSNKLDVTGNFNVNGNVKIRNNYPIIFRRYSNLGDNINYNTYYSTSTYAAAIIGFYTYDVDINENDAGNFIQLRMVPYSGEWYIRADLRSHNDHESWYVDVMYVRRELVNMIGY